MLDLSATPTAPIDTRIELKVNGRIFKTWKSININRSMAQIAGSFSFKTANRFAGESEKWGIEEGDECTVSAAGQRVLTGFIDEIEDGYTLGSHDITFSGRDKTADLVDCSYNPFEEVDQSILNDLNNFISGAKGGKGEFFNQTFIQIIKKLCAPFNVIAELDSGLLLYPDLFIPLDREVIQTGDSVYEKIVSLCQQFAVLPLTKGDGKLFLTRAGITKTTDSLGAGVNIKANKIVRSLKDRYSVYYVEGRRQTTAFNTKPHAEGKFVDEYMASKRTRPFIILLDENTEDANCQKRAAWEARIRMGASRKVETTVKGWTQSTGDIWPLNGLVSVKDNKIGIDNEFLIAGINLSLDSSGGESTTLSLVHPDTFVLKDRVAIKKDDGVNAFGNLL